MLLLLWSAAQCGAETLSHGRFENLAIYRPSGEVQRVVLFLSGEQGWNAQLSHSAQLLASQGALVAGIDSRALFANLERDGAECVFPDGDLENLSHFLQAYYRLPSYEPSVLVGYGAGATLSYAMLAQAPAETFAGGVSIDFCPALRLRKRLCEANSLHVVPVSKDRSKLVPDKLEAPWIVLQMHAAGACRAAEAQRFVQGAPGSEIVLVSQDGKSANWEAALSAAVQRLDPPPRSRAAPPAELAGLPIVEVPAKQPGDDARHPDLGRRRMGRHRQGRCCFARRSKASQSSAWIRCDTSGKSARRRARPTTSIASCATTWMTWDRKDVVLIGYSQGADVLPFVVNRLPAQTRARVRLAAMLGLGERAVFEFHLANWLSQSDDGLPIAPELQRMSDIRGLCVYSDEGDESSCPDAASGTLRAVNLPGGHHFGGDYDRVAALILEQLR